MTVERSSLMDGRGDVILIGRVLPLAYGLAVESAVGVRGELIVGVGSKARVVENVLGARVLDFGNRTILPGFIDTHTHAASTAIASETMVDCVNSCTSIEDAQQVLSDALAHAQESGWLVARGLLMLNMRWADQRYPMREDLDKVSTTVPIAIRTGHLTMTNTRTLEVVDIEKLMEIRQGSGGPAMVQLGADGQPNGLLNNLDAFLPFPKPDRATVKQALENGIRRVFTSRGVTSICEITDSRDSMDLFVDLVDARRLGSRLIAFIRTPTTMSLEDAARFRAIGVRERPGMFEIRGIKVFADGGYSSSDAAVYAPYVGEHALEDGSRGVLNFTDEELTAVIETAAEAGMELGIHTNGERSQEQVCSLIEQLKPDLPLLRLEHAGNWVWERDTPSWWRRANAQPVPQPMFLNTMAPAMPVFLGDYGGRLGRMPLKTLLDDGWELPSGSDCSLPFKDEVADPFFSMWCCMARRGYDGVTIEPEEAIDLEAALKMHTINGAKLLGQEDSKGTLERGKLADIVILDRDLLHDVDSDSIADVKVDYVFLGGRLVYRRDGAPPYVEQEPS
jgi:predicted amidohydrolase YtcJ